jgi:hypothetical protein
MWAYRFTTHNEAKADNLVSYLHSLAFGFVGRETKQFEIDGKQIFTYIVEFNVTEAWNFIGRIKGIVRRFDVAYAGSEWKNE